jgi:hypothetical protein
MADKINNNVLFQRVRDLKLPIGKYVLVGSTPMGIRGLRECHDIDIVVTGDIWDELCKKEWPIKYSEFGNQFLCKENIEIGNNFWKPDVWNVTELIREDVIIDGLPFMKLERVIEYKRLMRREKDLEDIKRI